MGVVVMSQAAVKDLVRENFADWAVHTNRAQLLDRWATGDHELPKIPLKASPEYRELLDSTATPWGMFMVSAVSQALFADTHRRAESSTPSKTFKEVCGPNGMLSRQGAIYRAALGQNMSYLTTLPSRRAFTGAPTVQMRGVPATEMAAFYDVDEDEFPIFAMRGEPMLGEFGLVTKISWRIYDEEAIYYLESDHRGDEVKFISYDTHGVGVTPVHRFVPWLNLGGAAFGQIQPFMPLLRRLDQDVFDRLIVQRFNSWRTRYASGLQEPETDAERRAVARYLGVTDMLISSDPGTKFGTLEATAIDPYVAAHDADLRDLAATSQTPPHHLLGQAANLSAEALAAAEASLMRKVDEIKRSFGQTWDQALRSCAFILANLLGGDGADYLLEATDYESSMRWADTESRSLSQTADALGKLADQLHIPVEMLWEQIPFWTKDDTENAKRLIKEAGADSALINFLDTITEANQLANVEANKRISEPAQTSGAPA